MSVDKLSPIIPIIYRFTYFLNILPAFSPLQLNTEILSKTYNHSHQTETWHFTAMMDKKSTFHGLDLESCQGFDFAHHEDHVFTCPLAESGLYFISPAANRVFLMLLFFFLSLLNFLSFFFLFDDFQFLQCLCSPGDSVNK